MRNRVTHNIPSSLQSIQNSQVSKNLVASEQLIEFEQALLAQDTVPNIANPCMKRTMLVGPKKYCGKKPNPQIHQHVIKKLNGTDFDTYSLVHQASTKAGSSHAYSRGGRFSAVPKSRTGNISLNKYT